MDLKDIQDHNYNSSNSFNISTTIGKTTEEKDGQKSKYPNGSTTIGLNSSGQETEQLTKATMGQGVVKNTVDNFNRDINNTQEITRDQTTGMLDGSITVDHRLLTENGRAEIVQEQKDLPENFRQSAENLAKALPKGEYKDKVLQTLNNVQSRLYDLPAEYKETGIVGDKVASELLKRGIEPKEVEALFSKLDFFYAAKEFSEIQNQLTDLEKSGVNLETIFKQPKAGGNEQETIYAQGTDFETKVSSQTTLGMLILRNVADLGNSIEDISESTGVDIEKVQLAVGLLISGPVRLVIESGKSVALDSIAGEKISQGFNVLATSLTAAAHTTSSNTINNWTNSEKIKEIENSTSENKLDELKFSEEIKKNKQGAEYLINAAAGVVVGGIGKGAAKGKEDGSIHSSSNLNEEISALNRIKENEKGADLSNKSSDSIINQQASKRVDQVTAPIDFDGHILNTEINSRGRLTGGHSIANGNINVISKATPNAQGVYEAKISVPDPKNPNKTLTKDSTMFPDSWNADRIKVEVDAAYKTKSIVINSNGQSMWEGITPSGVKVRGYLEPNTTVYPLMK